MRRFVLPDVGRDLCSFRIEGSADGSPVSASWDGRVLSVTDGLVARVALARAVDAIYRTAGLEMKSCPFTIVTSARRALVTLVEVCEAVTCVEYRTLTETKRLV